MKQMNRISFLLLAFFIFSTNTNAQILKKIKDRVAQTAENKVVNKAGDATEKTMDKMEEDAKRKKNSNGKNNSNNTEDENQETNDVVQNGNDNRKMPAANFQSYSKFDFVPGETTIFYEDFASDAVGDFPDRWNTNVSGEVVTSNAAAGKWFRLKPGGGFIPDGVSELPENFTIEFDLVLNHNNVQNPGGVYVDLYGGKTSNKLDDLYPGENGVKFFLGSHGYRVSNNLNGETGNISTNISNELFYNNPGKVHRISIWRQKQRVRLYINEAKIYDLPRVLPATAILNLFRLFTWDTGLQEEETLLVSNIRIAIGAPDMRSKLITEGKLVTQGILFDVNSDKIKPESAGTLKSIADVLKENASVKVKIIGHTDSDGNDATNLALSKKRSVSVKDALNKEYGIDASRMETDGFGESKPIADNGTAEGKANNRRVEFVKM